MECVRPGKSAFLKCKKKEKGSACLADCFPAPTPETGFVRFSYFKTEKGKDFPDGGHFCCAGRRVGHFHADQIHSETFIKSEALKVIFNNGVSL